MKNIKIVDYDQDRYKLIQAESIKAVRVAVFLFFIKFICQMCNNVL